MLQNERGRMLIDLLAALHVKKMEARRQHANRALSTKHRHAISTFLLVLDLYFRH